MHASTPLTDICSMYGTNIAQVKVSLTSVTCQVVLSATKICRVSKGESLREKCPNTEFFLVRIFPHLH